MPRTSRAGPQPLTGDEVSSFAQACTTIANSAADEQGFVAIPKLLERFHAKLLIRPLLVEGMLATQPNPQSEWAVLIDSETYGITDADVQRESSSHPLPSRLRFTVAHELVHSLAFRPSDFGIRLKSSITTGDAKSAVVRAIEGVTDRLTPLLLLSETALVRFFKAPGARTSATDLALLARTAGVSRRALIGRLRGLSPEVADRVSRYSLNNLAVCIAEWREQCAIIRKWPLFARFDRNVLPEFLLRLPAQDRLPAPRAIPEYSFAACGGDSPDVQCVLRAGSVGAPDAVEMTAQCSLEPVARTIGNEFFIVVRKTPLTLPVAAQVVSDNVDKAFDLKGGSWNGAGR